MKSSHPPAVRSHFHNRPCNSDDRMSLLTCGTYAYSRVWTRREFVVFSVAKMLSLVDYTGSDDEDIDESHNEECIYAEVVSNRTKSSTFANKDDRTTDEFKRLGDVALIDDITNAEEQPSILTNLPPALPLADKRMEKERDLEDLVKRKDWELKLAKKAERRRKRHHKISTNRSSKNYRASKSLVDNKSNSKKLVVIQAFSGLKGLAGDEKQGKSDEQPAHLMTASSSANLLTVLPEPKNASRTSRNLSLFTPNNTHSSENAKMSKIVVAREISKESKFTKESDDGSDEDHDSTDFFGLKAFDNPPVVSNITSVSNISDDKKLGQVGLTSDAKVGNNIFEFVSNPEIIAECYDTSTSTTSSGVIDDSQALYMIYSRDIAHLGGTVSNAAKAVENIVDVSVDKVLGPNVRSTLLKNLHNKSLAEATLSHLASMPKSKDTVSMLARRKHQITYLASVAVAREEQLAEQWSVNRHNKRTSARKYGF
uniref:Bm2673 n=3 Tax=Brugia malayi TaxID=6279 RepID=A0A0H5SCG7_BRUMA|nr:Bm2673 [Brugia malayi]